MERLLHLTSVKSAAFNYLSGSQISKCLWDKEVGISGETLKILEFRQASISTSNMHRSS